MTVLTAVADRSWVAPGVPAGADVAALGATMLPIDALDTAGLGALRPHVQPLQDVLDNLAGNASVVRSFADTWQRTAEAIGEVQQHLTRSVPVSTAEWHGEASERYRLRAGELSGALRGTAALSAGVGVLAATMAEVVAGARTAVNDLLADLVQRLISYVRQASAAEGGLTANVLTRATALIDSYRAPVATIENGVRQSVTNAESRLAAELTREWGELWAVFEARGESSPLVLAQAAAAPQVRGVPGHRGGAYLSDGGVRLEPLDGSVPSVTVPNRMGATGFTVPPDVSQRDNEHTYRVATPTDLPFDRAKAPIGDALAGNAVPTWGESPATAEGVRNNAGLGNDVMSFRVASPDPERYTDITVNYTIAGEHLLHEGYVIRYGERNPDGTTTVVSYGEGNSWWQQSGSPANWLFGQGWEMNNGQIVDEARDKLQPR